MRRFWKVVRAAEEDEEVLEEGVVDEVDEKSGELERRVERDLLSVYLSSSILTMLV